MIMKIEVLGSGCPTCKTLHERTTQAVQELSLAAEVTYVTDIQKMIAMGVMSSPVLAIDDVPVLTGQLPTVAQIKDLITATFDNTEKPKCDGCSCGGNC